MKAGVRESPQDGNPPGPSPSAGGGVVPPLSPIRSDEPATPAGDSPRNGRLPRPPADPALARTDGPASAAGEPGPPADRLPAGKQSVAVTVEVQSPPSMNLHLPATVRLVIRNTGASDAMQVRIRDELPEGLKYVSSQPEAKVEGAVLTWSLDTMPAGSVKEFAVKVEPVKTGPLEHGASVWFQTGSMATTKVVQPRLKIEQKPSADKALKGRPVEFEVLVTNIGDGPASQVTVTAKLSPGLRYGSGGRGGGEMITEPIPVLAPDQTYELDPLVATAVLAGDQACTVTARSVDVVPEKGEEASSVAAVTVVEPKLTVAVTGPQKRCTDTNAVYQIAVANPGTAPARKVRVIAFVPPGARLLAVPKDARYDSGSRRLQWATDALQPGPDPWKLAFEVKVGAVGSYEINAEASADGVPKARQKLVTDVFGMADVDLVVSERQRVVNVGGRTTFQIRLRNYGTKDATNILLKAYLSKNLKVLSTAEVPEEFDARRNEDGHEVVFQGTDGHGIKRLEAGKDLIMFLEVEVTGDTPKVATCKVTITHDELSEPYEDMAGVKVLPSSSRPAATGAP